MNSMLPAISFYFRCFLIAALICCLNYKSYSKPSCVAIHLCAFVKDTLPQSDSLNNEVFEKTELPASVNAVEWRKYLEIGLMKIIKDATASGIKNGNYRFDIRFIIEKNGSLSDPEALENPLQGPKKAVEKIKKEVENLVLKGPKWMPAEINGEKVRSFHTQAITFMIAGM